MKAKQLILLAAVLFALSCGGDRNPMGADLPIKGDDNPECNSDYNGGRQSSTCIPQGEQ